MRCSRRSWLVGCIAAGLAQAQEPAPAEVLAAWPNAKRQGAGVLRFLGLQVYEIRLWINARRVDADWAQTPLALELRYVRSLKGRLIAERSLKEMSRQAEIPAAQGERWMAAMTALFPDVGDGDRITGIQLPGESARFYFNGEFRGEVRDPAFVPLFFGIWLSPRTSEPRLREQLLGGSS